MCINLDFDRGDKLNVEILAGIGIYGYIEIGLLEEVYFNMYMLMSIQLVIICFYTVLYLCHCFLKLS